MTQLRTLKLRDLTKSGCEVRLSLTDLPSQLRFLSVDAHTLDVKGSTRAAGGDLKTLQLKAQILTLGQIFGPESPGGGRLELLLAFSTLILPTSGFEEYAPHRVVAAGSLVNWWRYSGACCVSVVRYNEHDILKLLCRLDPLLQWSCGVVFKDCISLAAAVGKVQANKHPTCSRPLFLHDVMKGDAGSSSVRFVRFP